MLGRILLSEELWHSLQHLQHHFANFLLPFDGEPWSLLAMVFTCSKMSRVFKAVQSVQSCVDSVTEALLFCFKGTQGVQSVQTSLNHFQSYVTASCSSGIQLAFKVLVLQQQFHSINFKIVEIYLIPKVLFSFMWISDFHRSANLTFESSWSWYCPGTGVINHCQFLEREDFSGILVLLRIWRPVIILRIFIEEEWVTGFALFILYFSIISAALRVPQSKL